MSAFPRRELVLALIMALAAVGTAWAGFQSAKWGGVQANAYAAAGAVRSDAGRASTLAAEQRTIDVVSFTTWLNALNNEIINRVVPRPAGDYRPDPDTASGFLFQRMRPEFRPAVDAWLATRPLVNAAAPATPFDMPQYRLAADADAQRLLDRADELSATARAANQRSDNYVLIAVVLALVLLFAGLAGKTAGRLTQTALATLAGIALLGAVTALLLSPVEL
ncbi:hypothetical protein ACFQY4_19080 [Catellatospora bangladeshensis]|uniref:Uncharacterized protein n=1 Tax=Catellatospora bangladeshensis TaxID=310355 RepID=A0A8J3NL17_9ACTN|nr:hypothetical protein [Catellatospora bangladeshensis]GIF84582.1 hypothetical protein Cba03nite_59310 [Catellatospora bangladeshensis]